MNLKPLGTKVIIAIEEMEEKTAGGIIIPGTQRKHTDYGRIVAVGPEVEILKENDRVLYESFSGVALKEDDKDYLVLDIKNILAVEK